MKKTWVFIVVLFTIGLAVLLGIALGRYSSQSLSGEMADAACAVSMTEIIASAQGDVYAPVEGEETVVAESQDLVTYSVEGDVITGPIETSILNNLSDEQNDVTLQNAAWDLFARLIPSKDRQMIVQYNIFTDGYSNTLAAVDQNPDDPSQWILEIDIADIKDKDSFLFTLIHEYAHLLTLNDSQVIPDQEIVDNPNDFSLQLKKAAACPTYFTGTGCSYTDSYIHAFYTRFWLDINDEWKKIDVLLYNEEGDDSLYYDGLYNFYKLHQDQFVDDYATTHPTEDIAESFAYFVFSPKPTGNSIKEQKIAFFYEYPELVELRANILSNMCLIQDK
ncbi:MAG: hypothetical protein JNM02_05800 [Anaerolineales bacterium]|nr:hypothetical protein [Anaerolineales bacterium]